MTDKQVAPALSLHATHTARITEIVQGTAKMTLSARTPEVVAEATALAQASAERLAQLQKGWMQNWMDWAEYSSTLFEANTMPKFMDHASNIGLKAQAQMSSQMTDLSELAENISVSYSYWLSKQLQD